VDTINSPHGNGKEHAEELHKKIDSPRGTGEERAEEALKGGRADDGAWTRENSEREPESLPASSMASWRASAGASKAEEERRAAEAAERRAAEAAAGKDRSRRRSEAQGGRDADITKCKSQPWRRRRAAQNF
jgi:hypothetical protein